MPLKLSSHFWDKAGQFGLSHSSAEELELLVEQVRRGLPPEGREVAGTLIILEDKHATAEKTFLQLWEKGFEEGKNASQITNDIKLAFPLRK